MANDFNGGPARLIGSERPAGFNVIGHLGSSSGLGNTARQFVRMLSHLGYGVAGIDVDYAGTAEGTSIEGLNLVGSVDELPYTHNLIIVSIPLLPSLWQRRHSGLLASRFRNAGLVFWELPVIPKAWRPSLELLDAILVCSPFVRHAIETAVPDVPTLYAEHPLPLNAGSRDGDAVRARLGIPVDAFVFCASFDLRSDYSRKNPDAAISAFLEAFPGETDVRLLIKTNGDPDSPSVRSNMAMLNKSICDDNRILLVTDTLPYDEVLSIYNACDVFVSLHRAEGLGLGPMEAMLLGKLVVATGYSGNMSYMTEQNSMPIPYRLVAPERSGWQFRRSFAGETASWAEVDIDQAAIALRTARDKPESSSLIAARGARDILERQEAAWNGGYLPQLVHYLDSSDRVSTRKKFLKKVRMAEVADSTLLGLNIRAITKEFT